MWTLIKNSFLVLLITSAILVLIDQALIFSGYRSPYDYRYIYCSDSFSSNFFCDKIPANFTQYPLIVYFFTNIATDSHNHAIPLNEASDKLSEKERLFLTSSFTDRFSRWSSSSLPNMPKAEYIYSKKGYRIPTKDFKREPKKSFLAFLGGSFVHGDHLTYEEALPFQVEKRLPYTNSYNYGIGGGGIKEPLLATANKAFWNHILEDEGIFVYVYTVMHDDRIHPQSDKSPELIKPTIKLKEGNIFYAGREFQAYPRLSYLLGFLHLSGIGRLFDFHIKKFPKWDTEDILCRSLETLRDSLKMIKPKSSFVVLHYEKFENHFTECARALLNSNFYAPYIDTDLKEDYLPDGHPTPKANRDLAEYLAPKLKELLENKKKADE